MAFSVSWTYQILDKYSGPIKRIQKSTAAATRSLNKASVSAGKFGAKMANVQSGVASLAGVIGGALILKTFTNFESTMNKVQGVTRSTDEQFLMLRNRAKELGEQTRFSATQAAQGIEMLGRNGLKATAIMNGAIDATLQLSSATGADLANAANIATDVMENFNKKSSQQNNK